MRKSRFTEQEIIGAVKQIEAGILVKELSRKYGVSEKTLYTWHKKYAGLAPSELQRQVTGAYRRWTGASHKLNSVETRVSGCFTLERETGLEPATLSLGREDEAEEDPPLTL